MLKYMSDAAVLGCLAAREALEDADAKSRFSPERIGLYAGTGLASANINESPNNGLKSLSTKTDNFLAAVWGSTVFQQPIRFFRSKSWPICLPV